MINPRLELLASSYGTAIWRVDGKEIRDRLDIEFTNGSEHYASPYIPHNEIWVDREAHDTEEWLALVPRLLDERDSGAAGKHQSAMAAETNFRRYWRQESGIQVMLVRGKAVRDWIWTDFVQGGHHLVYDFIPRGQIWIDNALVAEEFLPTVRHELYELRLMSQGMSYAEAHERSSLAEVEFRRKRRELNG
jgi:hypothetical protein